MGTGQSRPQRPGGSRHLALGPVCYRTPAWEVLVERGVNTGTPIEADPLILTAGMSHRAVTERILALAGRSGYKAAVIDAVDGTVTAWPRFGWTIRAAAHGLSRRGLAAGDTAGVFVQDAASFALAVNAIRAAGATALPIRPDAGVADVTAQLNAGGVRLLITSAPLAGLAAEAADRSRVRQVFAFGEAAGTTPFRSLLTAAKNGADNHGADTDGRPEGAAGRPEGAAGLPTSLDGRAGLCRRDVVVAGPPCGDGYAYASLLDLILLTGATIVAAPVPLVAAAMRVYQGTAAIVPCGTVVPGLPQDRVFTVALSGSPVIPRPDVMAFCCVLGTETEAGTGFCVRISVTITSRLHTSRIAAKPNAAAIPCVSTCCEAASGVSPASG